MCDWEPVGKSSKIFDLTIGSSKKKMAFKHRGSTRLGELQKLCFQLKNQLICFKISKHQVII